MMIIGAPGMTGSDAAVDFTAFFGAEYERLFQSLYLLCGNKSDAEDLAQETMARAFERWDRVVAAETPTGYIFQIGFNLHRSMLRRARRALTGGSRVAVKADPNLGQTRLEVLEALSSLPAAQRQALVLVEWLGFSAEEAGHILRIAPSSVRGRLHRARGSLRETFGGIDA
ncbi:MAG: sigma-70 family RNA polymerase sigma factor [Actinobacteria bacterium]|nr:MAG: sigma-70 family RNA polymerase sigma factor [Actinomycetota bacterium]